MKNHSAQQPAASINSLYVYYCFGRTCTNSMSFLHSTFLDMITGSSCCARPVSLSNSVNYESYCWAPPSIACRVLDSREPAVGQSHSYFSSSVQLTVVYKSEGFLWLEVDLPKAPCWSYDLGTHCYSATRTTVSTKPRFLTLFWHFFDVWLLC